MPSLSKFFGPRRTSPTFVWCATALGLLVNLIFVLAIARDYYFSTLASNVQAARNVATLIEHDVARNIELLDLSLRAVTEGLKDPEVMAQPARLRQITLFDRSTTAKGLGAIVVLDRSGSIVLDSLRAAPRKGNFADREYFKIHESSSHDIGLYISKPFKARLQDDTWSISLSRRLSNPDGSFAGIVSGTVRLDYFKDQFDSVELGRHGSIALLRDDGVLLIRNIDNDQKIGADWSSSPMFRQVQQNPTGTFRSENSMDGVARLYAYQRIAYHPIVVSVGLSEAEILAPWWSKVKILAAVFSLMAISIVILVSLFVSELRRRERAELAAAALARKDGLTNLVNRRGFDEALAREWKRATRDRSPLSLILIDLDHFKQFNDTYGHPEGDRVLAAVSDAVAGTVNRPGDVAARYGGEELVVLLPDTGEQGAVQIAQTIQLKVRALTIPHVKSPYQIVTISAGVATIVPSFTAQADQLLQNADAALYSAKKKGRNEVCVSNVAAPDLGGWRKRA